MSKLSAVAGTILLLAGCVANRISVPAKTLDNDLASFQGSLSEFQDQLKQQQSSQRSSIAGTVARRDFAIAATKQMQVEWAITSAKNGTEIFAPLQDSGRDAV